MKYIVILLIIFATGCIAIKPSERIRFTAPDEYPEGVTYDAASDMFFVSSQRTGTIGKVSRSGNYTVLYADSNLKSTYGMRVHPDGRRLFVCVGDANYSRYTSMDTRRKMARLISIDINTGKKLSDLDLANVVPGRHFPNDFTFDDKGNIYMTDSYANAIYKITPDNKASLFAKSDLFETAGIGINGIAYDAKGYLLVNNTNTGTFYRVDMSNPKNVQKVKSNQFFVGADGLLLKGTDTAFVCVNSGTDKVYQLITKDDWQSAELAGTTLIAERFSYPASSTFAGNEVWVMNARTNELADSNAIPSKIFALQKVVIKPIPKKMRQ